MKSLKFVFFFSLFFAFQNVIAQGVVSTVAGLVNQFGYNGDGIAATSAKLFAPYGVAVDTSGNFYIADLANNRVRKVNPKTGLISTVAGNGTQGFSGDGGLATNAALNYPTSVTVDINGNVYFSDLNNKRIRKVIKQSGVIVTIAGSGTAGYNGDGIAATSANLTDAFGVAVDSKGNVFIADASANRVRKVSASTGIISTVAGDGNAAFSGDGGLGTNASLSHPNNLVYDGTSNSLLISDGNNFRVRKLSLNTGIITTIIGNGNSGFSGDGSLATNAQISGTAISLDKAGRIYLADIGNNRVRLVQNGIINTIAGTGASGTSGDGGSSLSAEFNGITGLAVDNAGIIYVSESVSRIRKISPFTLNITSFTPSIGCSGSTVKIFGKGFTGAKAVLIGGVTSSYSVINDSIISATISNGAITGKINVIVNGDTAKSKTNFIVGSGLKTYAYVANNKSNTISVIDNSSNSIASVVPFSGSLKLNPSGDKLYVSSSSTTVNVINATTNAVIATIAGLTNPGGILFSPDGSKIYIQESGGIAVIDAATNTILNTINLGALPQAGITITPDGSKLYISNWDYNTVTVIITATNAVQSTIAVGSYPLGIGISPDGSNVYVANQLSGTVSVINTLTDNVIATVNAGGIPAELCVSPDGNKVYVSNDLYSGTVTVINTNTKSLEATLSVGNYPIGIAITPDGSKVYVKNSNSPNGAAVQTSVSIINTATNSVIATVQVGLGAGGGSNFIGNVIQPCSNLPLRLVSFQGKHISTGNKIEWSTANEVNTANFVVERSSNGSSFSQVGLALANGSGNNSYVFTDINSTEATTLYYRLKMMDKDGSFTYSHIVQMEIPKSTATQAISLAPNPANNVTKVYFKQGVSDVAIVSVYNSLGLKVYAQEFGGGVRNSIVLPTASMVTGSYIVNVSTTTGEKYCARLQVVR